jgi:hypothetical protein
LFVRRFDHKIDPRARQPPVQLFHHAQAHDHFADALQAN